MNNSSLLITAAVILVAPVIAQAAPRSEPVDESAALNLLERTLKQDHMYTHRISWDCISYITEETTSAYFQLVLRENHNAKCGGDPETSPAIDRYRVFRRAGKIEWLEQVEDRWRRYDRAKIK
ncbi:MAG TPA: hypothetical protein VGH06_08435 [Candidatus Udaeobacter sp.]|jgi:hypothetical protein